MSDPVRLRYPFRGRWLVRNSPADRVPSHGTHVFGTTYAVDFLAVDEEGRSAAIRPSSLLRPEAPERFPGFNRPVLSPTAGIVVAAHDGEADHEAYRGLPSVGYALTQHFVWVADKHDVLSRSILHVYPLVVAVICLINAGDDRSVPERGLSPSG